MIVFSMKFEGLTPTVIRRQLPKIMRLAYRLGAGYWGIEFLPKHFEPGAKRRYSLGDRQGETGGFPTRGSYTWQKQKKYGHRKPLVWSGRSRDRALIPTIKATPKYGQWKIGSSWFNATPSHGRFSMREEVLKTIPRELDVLLDSFADFVFRGLKNTKTSGRRRAA